MSSKHSRQKKAQAKREAAKRAADQLAVANAVESIAARRTQDSPSVEFLHLVKEWRGPTPSPDSLRQIDEFVPGGAGRFIKMAEDQAKHRRTLEAELQTEQLRSHRESGLQSRLGLIFGFIIVLTSFLTTAVLAFYLEGTASWLPGTVMSGGTLVALLKNFLNPSARTGGDDED